MPIRDRQLRGSKTCAVIGNLASTSLLDHENPHLQLQPLTSTNASRTLTSQRRHGVQACAAAGARWSDHATLPGHRVPATTSGTVDPGDRQDFWDPADGAGGQQAPGGAGEAVRVSA